MNLFYDDWSADRRVLEEFFGHVVWHADAAVGGRVTGEESGVHTDAAIEAEEVGHG